jgi:hypothetical protein
MISPWEILEGFISIGPLLTIATASWFFREEDDLFWTWRVQRCSQKATTHQYRG